MTIKNYDEARLLLGQNQLIDCETSFALAKLCSVLLRSKLNEHLGRDIAIRIKDTIANDLIEKTTLSLWNDVLVSAGLYPYVIPELLDKSSLLNYEYYKSPYLENVYLHQEQQQLSIDLRSGKAVIVSAPTSFGKSLLIEEVVSSRQYRNIVIIQPTLALLDETRKKLLKYKEVYKIIVSTSQEPSIDTGNIFLFTGERVVEYEKFQDIGFFVIDEFYKLSLNRDDDRAIALNQAFLKLLKFTSKFYMLGPMIRSIPVSVIERFDLVWQRTDFATVSVDESNVDIKNKKKGPARTEEKKIALFELLYRTEQPTLIYCSTPARCTDLTIELLEFLNENKYAVKTENVGDNLEMAEWIKQNLNKDWVLVDALQNSIAFHHGALPRHLGSSVVDAFNNGSIKFLFCTATLIEGVNTSAKNVILYDKTKGAKPIDFFDYKNIAGRSGRMRKHYIGNVIRFENEPQQLELDIDIPILTQENAPIEILLSIEEKDLKPDSIAKLKDFNKLPAKLKEVIKLNSGVNIEGQQNIVMEIEDNFDSYYQNLCWNNPDFNQLALVIDLGWRHLAKPGDTNMYIDDIGRLSSRWLTSFTFSYIINKSIGRTINQYINDPFWIERIPDRVKRVNRATFTILHIARHWFDYKLPKWLAVISNLQEYVCDERKRKPGSYAFLASSLENGFLSPGLAALQEYDVPITAIKKLENILDEHRTPEQNLMNLNQLSNEKLSDYGLIKYEINKLRDAL